MMDRYTLNPPMVPALVGFVAWTFLVGVILGAFVMWMVG
jgi:hypothetical protein